MTGALVESPEEGSPRMVGLAGPSLCPCDSWSLSSHSSAPYKIAKGTWLHLFLRSSENSSKSELWKEPERLLNYFRKKRYKALNE